jgi:HK97 family phage major capsid protein
MLSCAQISTRKQNFMNTQDLIEKRNKLMTDASAIATKGTLTTEDRSKFDTMIADAKVMDEDITRMQAVDKFNAEQRATTRPPRAGFGNDDQTEESIKNQKRAFKEWFRTGQVSAENRGFIRTEEQRDLGAGAITGSITGGNVLVPTGFDPVLHTAMKNYGQLVAAVGQLSTSSGNSILVATANDTTKGMTVIGEATAVSENDPAFAQQTSAVDTLTSGVVKISNQLLQDSEFDIENWLASAFGTRYYRGLTQMISQGNSSNIAALSATLGATSASPTAIVYEDLVNLYGSVDAAYVQNASWVMSSTTRANLMGLISTTGQPILQTDPLGNPFNAIFGRPIVINEYQSAIAATNTAILLGDLKEGYTLRQAGGFAIKRLVELYAATNESAYILYARAGGYNVDAGTHPVRSLVQHS